MAARNGQADAFAARPLLKDQRTKFRLGPRSENDPVADMRRFSIELGVLSGQQVPSSQMAWPTRPPLAHPECFPQMGDSFPPNGACRRNRLSRSALRCE